MVGPVASFYSSILIVAVSLHKVCHVLALLGNLIHCIYVSVFNIPAQDLQ